MISRFYKRVFYFDRRSKLPVSLNLSLPNGVMPIVRGLLAKPSAKPIDRKLLMVNLREDLRMAILVEPIADNVIQ